MTKPTFIDNQNGNTLAEAIASLVKTVSLNGPDSDDSSSVAVRIATAYFSFNGYGKVAKEMVEAESVRLLLGTEVDNTSAAWKSRPGESRQEFQKRILRKGLKTADDDVRTERDHIPFTKSNNDALKIILRDIRCGRLEVRRYEKSFLHAKVYIFTSTTGTEDGEDCEGILAGSSNFTGPGLTTNLELNVGLYDSETKKIAVQWFDTLWNSAAKYDMARIIEDILRMRTPWEIFIQVLWRLYGDDVVIDEKNGYDLPLTSFQMHGVMRVKRIIEETGGAIVADQVGLGKTFIAGEIVKMYRDSRQRALLLCPASLRDSTWKSFIDKYEIFLECRSYEELARDSRLCDVNVDAVTRQVLDRDLEEYQLIVIDEAHNYRNPNSPMRAGILRRLLYGAKRDVLLLTATPVNNSLWDLYQLIQYFVRQDAHFATQGIPSIKERFAQAMRQDPTNLSPDILYPIIDATTVKRTREFVRKHYNNDRIQQNGGESVPIVFPKPITVSVRYSLDEAMPGVFDMVEAALSPKSENNIKFARYKPRAYFIGNEDTETLARLDAMVGLLQSGLLKRFESSSYAFCKSVERMVDEHKLFLNYLARGLVLTTRMLKEVSSDDEGLFEILKSCDDELVDASQYNTPLLRQDVEVDMKKLEELRLLVMNTPIDNEQKLHALTMELKAIAGQSEKEAVTESSKRQLNKVIIFTSFADTAEWIYRYINDVVGTVYELGCYRSRVALVTGSRQTSDGSRYHIIREFAPESMDVPRNVRSDKYDVLISTDVLAEGVNLQQCRNIINFDLPWNPMRLVQRHGRIDRIRSRHERVYLRTIFPVDRLEQLLSIEETIHQKLAMAARSIGVEAPIEGAVYGRQVFSDTREEIEKLLKEDTSLFERGGTVCAAQTGEEYRQTLRVELCENRARIEGMPWKVGSIMEKNETPRGMFFHAIVGERSFLRFVCADGNWRPLRERRGIWREMGACLRVIECEKSTPTYCSEDLQEMTYEYWEIAKNDVHEEWTEYTDPANLQPRVRKLNRRVADYIRTYSPININERDMDLALSIVESPWSLREEYLLRDWFHSEEYLGQEKSKFLIERILNVGIEPAIAPKAYPPVALEEVELLCWMVIVSNKIYDEKVC